MRCVLLIEGNPYHTKHDIDRQAVKGALLSVSLCWQIPIIFSSNENDKARTMIIAANQFLKETYPNYSRAGNSKNRMKKSLNFLQGLPSVGPSLAKSLLEKFKTIENVILATEDELLEIEGLGKKKAKIIRDFLRSPFYLSILCNFSNRTFRGSKVYLEPLKVLYFMSLEFVISK